MINSLMNKAAIITGASSGIGAATARELSKLGCKLILVARNTEKLQDLKLQILQDGGLAEVFPGDVSDYKTLQKSVELCLATFGKLDFLINNAGVIDPISTIIQSDPEAWCRAVDINYKGVYFGLRAALPVMAEQQSGVIVNVSSGAAVSALEGWSHYCSSKAAALSLTRCAHKEHEQDGVTVVGLSPGTVATDMQVAIKASGINPVSQLDISDHISPIIPARAIAWLCAGKGKKYAGTDFSLKTEENMALIKQGFKHLFAA